MALYERQKGLKIAIDGASGTGKSTLARYLAKKLRYIYIDTGAMYRAFALYLEDNGLVSEDDSEFLSNAESVIGKVDIGFAYGTSNVTLNYVEVEDRIRNERISMLASRVSKFTPVREFLVSEQKKIAELSYFGIIMEGRDIATVVMPDADIKFFLTADVNCRAERRFKDYIGEDKQGDGHTVEEIAENLAKRDKQDSEREDSPLRMVDDAILVNTTNMTIDAKNDVILDIICREIAERDGDATCVKSERSVKRQYDYDVTYMKMAFSMAELSYAHRMKAGAIIVSKDDQIISQGYNGTPSGFSNCCEELDADGNLRTKDMVLHAEANAITKCSKSNMSSVGSTIYITASPCINCAKMIIQAGIVRVVFRDEYRSLDGVDLLVESGIQVEKMNMDADKNNFYRENAYISYNQKVNKIIKVKPTIFNDLIK